MLQKVESTIKSQFKIVDSITLPSGEHAPCIQGRASHSDVRSQKGYRYRRGFWDKVISDPKIQQKIANRDMLGMVEHPLDDDDYFYTPYDKASHIIMRAWMKDSDPWIVAALLNNEMGNNIKALVDLGHCPGISTRGLGDYLHDDVSDYIDENNYMLITWDIVRAPNFEDIKLSRVPDSLMSHPLYKEVVSMYGLRDSVDEHYNRERLLSDISNALQALSSIERGLKSNIFNF